MADSMADKDKNDNVEHKKMQKEKNLEKEVVKMRHYMGMSFKDIADVTGVSINTALGRLPKSSPNAISPT